MIGYKGFDKNFQCRGKQYAVGETVTENEMKLCENGLHFCEHPLDVFGYYSPNNSRYAEIEAENVSDETGDDTKRVCKKLTVKTELSLKGIIDAAVKFVFDGVEWGKAGNSNSGNRGVASTTGYGGVASNSGYRGVASTTGNCGAASNSGNRGVASTTGYGGVASNSGYGGVASTTGDYGAASTTGSNSFAVAFGIEGRAMASLGNWITLAEWYRDDDDNWQVKEVRSAKIDGETLKPDTYYWLKDGKIMEVDE